MTETTARCLGTGNALFEKYHDEEWGRPLPNSPDERELFELLSLEGFVVGLNWATILYKREHLREAFAGFEPARVAAFVDEDVERLLSDPGIIRNARKVAAVLHNARALCSLHERGGRLLTFFTDHAPPPLDPLPHSQETMPQFTDESHALARSLRKEGLTMVGPRTMHAMQRAMGLADAHTASCPMAATPA